MRVQHFEFHHEQCEVALLIVCKSLVQWLSVNRIETFRLRDENNESEVGQGLWRLSIPNNSPVRCMNICHEESDSRVHHSLRKRSTPVY